MTNQLKNLLKTISVVLFPAYFRKRCYRFLESIDWKKLPPEESELLLIKFFLERDKVFFDIGANIGIYTCYAQQFLPAGSIYAFEPLPDLYIRLKCMFGVSKIFKLALSNTSSRKKIKIP